MATLGGSVVNRDSGIGGDRTLITPYTFPTDGTVTHVDFYAGWTGTNDVMCLMVYRHNGSNWDTIGYSSDVTITATGSYGVDCNIDVLAGDHIGVFIGYYIFIDITSAGSITYWTKQSRQTGTNWAVDHTWDSWGDISLLVTYTPITSYDNIYVDINKADDTGAGTSWATAKKTMKAGWDILNALGTMHVASGNYSAQTGIIYNKSWKLSPEDPNTTGEKRVAIPPSV